MEKPLNKKSKDHFVANHDGSFSLECADRRPGNDEVKNNIETNFHIIKKFVDELNESHRLLKKIIRLYNKDFHAPLKIPKIK